ncbi:unnamed protein product [Candida verbasci]|uniref:VASt domain-containing protein n=1 Tax=Candida verbasci TaxID=1227364 RepID=A0A9W4U0A1_9ASCO|nr:unnamed protein product [Candida verbasci]
MPLEQIDDDDNTWDSMSSNESLDGKQKLIKRGNSSSGSKKLSIHPPISTIATTTNSNLSQPQPHKSQLSLTTTLNKTPLDPLTTKEDANSVVSKDSKDNNQPEQNNRFLKDLQEYEIEHNGNNDLQKSSSVDEDSSKLLASPKIIAYRKSKRTVSEGTFDSLISSPTSQTIPTSNSVTSPPKFDNKLYVDEFYKDSKFRYAVMKRNVEFHQIFKKLDLTDRLLDDFACALSREILLQGRIYISESYICFNSNLLGWVTNMILEFNDIVKVEKKSIAGLFPNGISIETNNGQVHTFASFLSRDSTYELMLTIWKGKTGKTNEDLTKEDETKIEETANEIEENKEIESYIMSIDGDDEGREIEREISNVEVNVVAKLVKLKPESKYTNKGPDFHLPTSAEYDANSNEIELIDEIISAPLGIVFDILFGSNTSFQTSFLKTHDGSEISEYDEFHPNEDDPTIMERKYNYRRNLGYSIGPKSTRCEVTEIIEHLNYSDYIIVTTVTSTPDVPSGNVFQVKTRYIFTWAENNSTNLIVKHFVEWSGKSWMKSVIEKSSLSGSKQIMKEMMEELKKEIEENTYFIDAPNQQQQQIMVPPQPQKKPSNNLKVLPQPPVSTTTTSYDLRNSFIYVLFVIIILQLFIFYELYQNRKLTKLLISLQVSSLSPQDINKYKLNKYIQCY